MAKKRRQSHKNQTSRAVTGDFELHFEDVVNKSRYMIMFVLVGGLLAMGLLVPGVVYYSQADTQNLIIEVEDLRIINPDRVRVDKSDNGYVEFLGP